MEKPYRYLGYFLLLFIPLIFFAFFKSYILPFPNFGADFDPTIHLHAFIATVWVAILIVQPFLIVNKKIAWHRTVGKFSYFVFPLLVLSFVPGILKSINRQAYANTFFPVADCVLLITFYALAIFYKKKSGKHMRYMIASALVLFGPTLGRIFPRWFGFADLAAQNLQYLSTYIVLVSLVFYDRKHNRKYQPYLIAMAGFFVHQLVFYCVFL